MIDDTDGQGGYRIIYRRLHAVGVGPPPSSVVFCVGTIKPDKTDRDNRDR